jgi:queuine tRNA-ribosyltransferase
MKFSFSILKKDTHSLGRIGKIVTPHGSIETPAYVPVGTQASVKALSSDDLYGSSIQVIFANTYHLYLRPGAELIHKAGGLHEFMKWDGPIFTDSGGYQVFSLGFAIEHNVGKMVKLFGDDIIDTLSDQRIKSLTVRQKLCTVNDNEARFVSHLDGSLHIFTPEISMRIQQLLGSDIVLALDECTSPASDYEYTKKSMERSHLWLTRSLKEFTVLQQNKDSTLQAMYSIVQGGPFEDLRIESAKFIAKQDTFGISIGGALVSSEKLHEILDWVTPHLPYEKPKHLLGIGTIEEIFMAVSSGIDTFDSTGPTREARSGGVFMKQYWDTHGGSIVAKKRKWRVNLTNKEFSEDFTVLEKDCGCYTCQSGFTKAYLRHLFISKELLVYRLLSIHNVYFMESLMKQIRLSILHENFSELKHSWLGD